MAVIAKRRHRKECKPATPQRAYGDLANGARDERIRYRENQPCVDRVPWRRRSKGSLRSFTSVSATLRVEMGGDLDQGRRIHFRYIIER
jgi:hypothetical protein